MRIVVTGALGHIGSLLIRELPTLFSDAEFVLLDDLSTQRFPSLFDLPSMAHYRFHECDVTRADIERHIAGAQVVIHLAALTDAASSFDRREQVEQVNFNATQRVASTCHRLGVPMLGFSSTSVYGTQKAVVDENSPSEDLKPQSPYAETKLREEQYLTGLAGDGLKVAVLRFGTIFGTSPGMRFHTAINRFCWQAVMGTPLTVWETAFDQRRPYLDIRDAVDAVAFFIIRQNFDGRVYNVVTVNATVREVVDCIREFVPDLQVRFVSERIMNQLSYDVSNARLSAAGWTPKGNMRSGIEDTVTLLKAASTLR